MYIPQPNVTEQKMEVQLPATIKTKLMGQMLVQKERGFIQVLCDLGEWRLLSQGPSPQPVQAKSQSPEFPLQLKVQL